MITLGSVTLPSDLVWSDRYKWQSVGQTLKETLTGVTVVFSSPLANGRPITLEAREDMGWLTTVQVQDVINLSNVPGQVFVLDYHGQETHNVVFKHDTPPAIEMQPLVDGQGPSDYFTGVIKLITV